MEPKATPMASKPKYQFKNGAKTITYPGLCEVTLEQINGENGESFVKAMKNTDKKKEAWKDNFSKLVEEVK